MFEHLAAFAGDPILSLVETFLRDERDNKVNLSIGIYLDSQGRLTAPEAVVEANKRLTPSSLSYLPMEGLADLRHAVPSLLLGAGHSAIREKRVASVQTLGGSGALKLAADLLRRWFPQSKAYVSNPTWDNHRGIFEGVGFEVGTYPYYNATTMSADSDAMCGFLAELPEKSIVLLHPCCHNPTGADLTTEQWNQVLDIAKARHLIVLMDIAYQGFGTGFAEDAYAVRRAAEIGLSFLAGYSFSKNMALYSERVGALIAVCSSEQEADLVLGQLKAGVRRIYSSPPAHGARIAAEVLGENDLMQQWQQEVENMAERIRTMRRRLHDLLQQKLPEKDFSFLIRQRGMFGYTGLSTEQVRRLRDEYGIYLVDSGRMCVAGLNENNIERTAQALAAVWK